MRSGPAEHGLTLSIASDDEAFDHDESARVSLRLTDASGSEVMSLHIPNHMAVHLATTQQNFILIMNIEGVVGCVGNGEELASVRAHAVEIDTLVAQAVSPDMLQDEPNASQLLTKFKERLVRSLVTVDEAIAALK